MAPIWALCFARHLVMMIATFLALLELMRMNLVRVQQIDPYQTIRIYLTSDRASQQEAMKIFQDSESEMDIS